MKYLIVGLGNIGPEYAMTRHNVGFMVLDRLAATHNFKFSFQELAFTAELKYKSKQIYFIKPTTFMNLSGKALRYYMDAYSVPLENVLVVVDELQLDFGVLRLKPRGSHGGHNGLKNIQELLQTQEYNRLRFGIGSDFARGRQIDYVLGSFENNQIEDLLINLDRAGDMVLGFCTLGVQQTMNNFNQ